MRIRVSVQIDGAGSYTRVTEETLYQSEKGRDPEEELVERLRFRVGLVLDKTMRILDIPPRLRVHQA